MNTTETTSISERLFISFAISAIITVILWLVDLFAGCNVTYFEGSAFVFQMAHGLTALCLFVMGGSYLSYVLIKETLTYGDVGFLLCVIACIALSVAAMLGNIGYMWVSWLQFGLGFVNIFILPWEHAIKVKPGG